MGVMEAVLKAQRMQKATLELTYTEKCRVEELKSVKDPIAKRTTREPVIVADKIPCKLSIKSSPALTTTETAAKIVQTIKLFLSPDIEIKSGSKITVTQNDRTTIYTRSGIPAVYFSHQEVELELFKEWS